MNRNRPSKLYVDLIQGFLLELTFAIGKIEDENIRTYPVDCPRRGSGARSEIERVERRGYN